VATLMYNGVICIEQWWTRHIV